MNDLTDFRARKTHVDARCFDLAEHFLGNDASEALKDALAREFQQVADDFCAEIEARQSKQGEAA